MTTQTAQTREQTIAERFARETANHTMTVMHDDGLYRHLRCRRPERGTYWFDIVTWPGRLVITGDIGEGYVFACAEDMFEFFRFSRWDSGPNAGYWAEKVVVGREQVETYSQELFNALVTEDLKEAEEDWPGVTKAWDEHVNGFLAEYNTEYEPDARAALNSFEYRPKGDDGEPFRFQDTWEWDLKDYHWWFLWSLHAIVWGIAQYDAARVPATAGSPS